MNGCRFECIEITVSDKAKPPPKSSLPSLPSGTDGILIIEYTRGKTPKPLAFEGAQNCSFHSRIRKSTSVKCPVYVSKGQGLTCGGSALAFLNTSIYLRALFSQEKSCSMHRTTSFFQLSR